MLMKILCTKIILPIHELQDDCKFAICRLPLVEIAYPFLGVITFASYKKLV